MYTAHPAEFDYRRPGTVDEAVALLAELDDARPLAGGHSLLPAMKLRLSTPGTLVDIGRIAELCGIERDGDELRIGALDTHAEIAASELVRGECEILAETAALIGDPQVRNRGTIGGSLAHADPGADYPTVVTALDATIEVAGAGGRRELAAGDFFTGIFETALEPNELVTAVRVPAARAGTGAAYAKHKHPASGYAVAGVAAVVSVEGGACTSARVVVGGVTGVPVEATGAAEALVGSSRDGIAAAAGRVPDALDGAIGDTYASGEYRVHLATVLARRALETAFGRASG